ncbi:glycosyltransferase family 39 protein [Amnibacterium flavum]|nr:glycosyltransferase family 39 protein [Amnibacterium flavum]
MSRVLERPTTAPPVLHGPEPIPAPRRHRGGSRAGRWFSVHARSISWLAPVLLIAGLVQAIGMAGSPQRIDDEGTYTAQAWSIAKLGEIAHYTYWYDHPPLGWLQLALYGQATFAFDRYDVAVIAMREAMLVAMVVSAALLWLLARKVGLSRAAASAAALLFAVSPLAVQFHRTVYLDNVALPWLLAAFLLAMTKRNQLAGFAGAALAFGIAVLSKETFLLALPVLAWVMWRSSNKATRRYTLSVAGSVLVLVGGTYLLLAGVKGEIFPGPDRVSLTSGIAFQLANRESSGSAFDPDSLLSATLGQWLQLDPVILVGGAVAALAGLFARQLRPFAVLYLGFLAVIFRPGGYTPVPFVIGMLPFAALLIAWGAETAIRAARRRGVRTRAVGIAGIAIALTGAIVAAPVWATQLRGLWLADLDRPLRDAQSWVSENVSRGDRVVVDDAMWVDLVESGFPRDNVIWYYKVDTDSDVQDMLPNGWQDFDYVVTTGSMRTFPDNFPQVAQALDNSRVVAEFGTGTQAVEIRKVYPEGIEAADEAEGFAGERRQAFGGELASNPRLTIDPESEALLTGGGVNESLTLALGQLLSTHELTIAGFPAIAGEDGVVRRQVLITSVDGEAVTPGSGAGSDLAGWFAALGGSYDADETAIGTDGLTARYSID